MITTIHGLGLRELIKETQKIGPSWRRLASYWTNPSSMLLEHPHIPAALWSLVRPCDYILTDEMHTEVRQMNSRPGPLRSSRYHPLNSFLLPMTLEAICWKRQIRKIEENWAPELALGGMLPTYQEHSFAALHEKRNKFLVFLSHWDLGCICCSIVLP